MDDLIVENVKRGVVDVAKSEVSLRNLLPSNGFSRWRHPPHRDHECHPRLISKSNVSHCPIPFTIHATGHPETMGQSGRRRVRARLRTRMVEGFVDRVDQGSVVFPRTGQGLVEGVLGSVVVYAERGLRW